MPLPHSNLDLLEAVNQCLAAGGQNGVTTLDSPPRYVNTVFSLLSSADIQIQQKEWSWNTIKEYPATRDSNNRIPLPDNVISLRQAENFGGRTPIGRKAILTIRYIEGVPYLFDMGVGSFEHKEDYVLRLRQRLEFEEMPIAARNVIVAEASLLYNSTNIGDALVNRRLELRRQEAYITLEQIEDEFELGHNATPPSFTRR